jgi:hypothetical protein
MQLLLYRKHIKLHVSLHLNFCFNFEFFQITFAGILHYEATVITIVSRLPQETNK